MPFPFPASAGFGPISCRRGSSGNPAGNNRDDSGHRSHQAHPGNRQFSCGTASTYNALEMSFRLFDIKRDSGCPVCGEQPSIKELIDYEEFCGMPVHDRSSRVISAESIGAESITPDQLRQRIEDGKVECLLNCANLTNWKYHASGVLRASIKLPLPPAICVSERTDVDFMLA